MPHRLFENFELTRCTCRISVALLESVLSVRTDRHNDFTCDFRYGVGESMHSLLTREEKEYHAISC